MGVRRVALTGGIGTGKSAVRAQFAALGVPTSDADTRAREAVAPGSAGLAAVVQRFGRSVLGVDGSLDRVALGALVFRDADARRALESIVHPIVQRETEAWFTSLPSTTPFAVAEIPLLYEIARERDFDAVVVAACDLATQLARLRARGMGEEDAARRIAAQLPLADKVRRADYVICTDGTMDNTAEGAAAVCAALGQRWGAAQDATSAPHADA